MLVALFVYLISLFFFSPDADDKVCGGGRRRSGEDLSAHLLHNQQVPFRVCSHCKSPTRRHVRIFICVKTRQPILFIVTRLFSKISSEMSIFPTQTTKSVILR